MIVGTGLSTVASAACLDISGIYRCYATDAPESFTNTQFVQTTNLLSVIDISNNGTKTTTDEFYLDGRSHIGAFGIIYTAKCEDQEPLRISMRNAFLKVDIEYRLTPEGLIIFRNGDLFMTCTR